MNSPSNRSDRRTPRRVDRRVGSVALLESYRSEHLDRLGALGEVATTYLPDPLDLLRSTLKATRAAIAEIVLYDGRSSRWSTDPLANISRHADLRPGLVQLPLSCNGELIGELFLVPHADSAVDLAAATTASHLVALALGAARLSTQLAAELDDHEHDSTHDNLTGLANRVAFEQAVDAALTRVSASMATTQPHAAALVVFDLNRFKEINASFGHSVGDTVVAEVAQRLVRSLRVDCAAARIGGDSFAVLFSDVVDLEDAQAHALRLLRAVSGPVDAGEATIHIDAAMGMAVAPFHGVTRSILVRHADVAMYVAKELPESTLEVWDPVHERVTTDQLELVVDLREAIELGELDVHYQPKTDANTGEVTGAEALVRWRHPIRGSVPPDELVPLAEHTGLIHDLTWFVLHTALPQCAQWHRAGHPMSVAVNLPARSLRDIDLPEDIDNALQAAGLSGEWLTLEITESEFTTDSEVSRSVVERIKALGVRLSIDDFGTGYSALAYLARLDVDELKIDKSFVVDLADNPANLAIVRAVIEVAGSFGLETVAEGVEDERSLEHLRQLGCTTVQGYLVSRPLPADVLIEWLHRRAVSGATTQA